MDQALCWSKLFHTQQQIGADILYWCSKQTSELQLLQPLLDDHDQHERRYLLDPNNSCLFHQRGRHRIRLLY